jgi:hypothetical protein
MNTGPQMNAQSEAATLVVAIAMVVPIFGIVLYGFRTGWMALGFESLAVMAVIAIVYYLLLRLMMKYKQPPK